MGDAGAMARGFAAFEKVGPLEAAGKTEEAIALYKESIQCFTVALRNPSLSLAARKQAAETVKYFQNKVETLEGELAASYFDELLPEAPSTKPVAPVGGARPRSSAPARGRAEEVKVEQEEERGNQALNRAMLLEKEGAKDGWRDQAAKKRAADEYAEAAGAFLSATNLCSKAPGGNEAACNRNKAKATQAITKAEFLTGVAKAASPAPVTPTQQPRKTPAPPRSPARPSQGELTTEEVGVLKDSSYVNGKLFMPWIADDLQEKFDYPSPWTDQEGLLPLSEPQKAKLLGWKRPSEVMPGEPRMITNVNPYSIKQDLITDCSFVASLCIASAFERRFHKQLITSIVYPQDKRRMPVYNPSGKYLVKLTVNGVARKVVVDDYLPTGNNGRLLCSASADKTELWVSIIEKAYLKVNGGYDFPGSNSGIDLFALTGWLPEQIFFEEHREANGGSAVKQDQPLDNYEKSERVWQRLLSAHEFGDCLITVATSEIEKDEADRLGLVPSHAYAVLDAKEVNGTRLLQVKNPWSRKRWTGPYSVEDTLRWTPALKQAVKYDLETAQLKDNGVFWIDFASIVQYFRNVFMNWNPALFSHRFVTHARWPADSGPSNDNYNVGDNPQLSLVVQSGATAAAAGGAMSSATSKNSPMVWVLLSRHVTTLEVDSTSGDFLTVHVYGDTDGKRVYYPGKPMFRGLYTNNPHTLVRFDLPETTTRKDIAYTLVISQYEKKREVRYTVNVYCTSTFRLFETPAAPEHRRKFMGTWDAGSAGGGMGRAGYYTNPQYALVLTHPKTKVHVELKAPRDYKVNITIVSEGGMRVNNIPTEREVMSSGSYRPGFCYAEDVLPAGTYTMVISTYKPNKIGGFFLELSTSSPVRLPMRIPAEGEGMSKQVILGRWREDDGSAAGCGNFGRYLENPRYVINATSTTNIVLRVAVAETAGASPEGRPAVNVTLYNAVPEVGDGGSVPPEAGHAQGKTLTLDPRCRPTSSNALATSNKGTYLDSGGGSATELVQVEAGEYIAVVSAFSPQEADFVFTVYSAPAVAQVYRMA